MSFEYINEAFRRLDILDEEMFGASYEGIDQLSTFLQDDDQMDAKVRIIDADAESDEDLQDSYVGKVIVNCNICHSHVFADKDEITLSEEGVAEIDKQCPYCGEQEGFTIIGEISPYNEQEPTEPDEPSEETDEQEIVEPEIPAEEDKTITEDFKEVSIKTEDQHLEMSSDENGKVTVVTEPIANTEDVEGETIAPISAETQEDILANNDVTDGNEEEFDFGADIETEPEETDIEIDEVDEQSMDDLGESYFRKVYENVDSYKTTSAYSTPTSLIVEGVITFDSGARKKTGFIFEACDRNPVSGKLRFSGSNKQITESKDAFSLVGSMDNKKLFVESLKYSYTTQDKAVRGVVRKK